MRNDTISSLDRRGFLRLGALAGVLGAVGCGGDETGTVTTPPKENTVRSRLDLIKGKADEVAAKKKKK